MAGNSSRSQTEALGSSEAFVRFQEDLSRVAKVDRSVLIVGERGTGKELASRRLHYLSHRWNEPFVALNCAALTATLIEAELFGHESGAFTGAKQKRAGRFETAHGGTLFLDEIGMIPLEVQAKILRVVEYGCFERVGGSEPVTVDVRIIGATNADLPALCAAGKFKQDLLDRLSFEVLHLPPLRERGDDIMLLANHFAAGMASELAWEDLPIFHPDAEAALLAYPWRGNIRELKNVVERAIYRAESSEIITLVFDPFRQGQAVPEKVEVGETAARFADLTNEINALPDATELSSEKSARDFNATFLAESGDSEAGQTFAESVAAFEIEIVRHALERARFNQRRAAESLGLTYHQFRGLYRKYGEVLESTKS